VRLSLLIESRNSAEHLSPSLRLSPLFLHKIAEDDVQLPEIEDTGVVNIKLFKESTWQVLAPRLTLNYFTNIL
jgi:hypothetical protein